jgi:hypothetical protein
LHDVFGFGTAAEHAVGDTEEAAADRSELRCCLVQIS